MSDANTLMMMRQREGMKSERKSIDTQTDVRKREIDSWVDGWMDGY